MNFVLQITLALFPGGQNAPVDSVRVTNSTSVRVLVRQRISLRLGTTHMIVAAGRTSHSPVDRQLLLSGGLLSRVNETRSVGDDVTILALVVRHTNATG